ncbi:hypothetical protein [Methylotenera sp.]|uniref:hypothetical protein n=1 Tax=Methylotenera sp. TaxID=2051956 RepID=UPI002488AA4E|nr:hypothetical protein [Methylotenera sp.]MDI1298898.1 hypothetical protein [Methylotenera sp.]
MLKNSLLSQNPYLANAKVFEQALRVNVLSSMAIEGVKKPAEKALATPSLKIAKR